ncbi:guanylin [Tiliqua scincoides]|uniref:guanylin n=1 Tax=Tiliqua scincoides TaxID=71010 RepID=UPI00346300DD
MNTYLTVALCVCAVAAFADGVTVTVEDFKFSLESVKKLNGLKKAPFADPRVQRSRAVPECLDPELPKEFVPLCSSPRAPQLFEKLGAIAREAAICEICANVACSGC